MKKIIVTFLCLACLLGLTVTAFATASLPSIIDEAGLLTDNEKTFLENQANTLQTVHGFDIVILTVDSTNGRAPRQYAEQYYDRQGYANDGILLLLSMEERDWYICTTGKCQNIFTSYGIDKLGEHFVHYLSDGNYFRGFGAFMDQIPVYCEAYENGKTVDATIGISHVLIALCIGAVVGGITVAVMRSSMKNTRRQYSASEYILRDSFRLTGICDTFLYSRVTKTPRPTDSSGPHGGGGGSRSHSGGGGKF